MDQNPCHAATVRTNKTIDPFAGDPFGDSWDKPEAEFDSDDNLPWKEETFGDCDWGMRANRQHAEEKAKQRAKRQREKRLQKERAVAAEYVARELKKKAAFEAAEVAVAMAKAKVSAAAKKRWDNEVERANEALALAKPAETLRILLSLFGDDSFVDTIDIKEQLKAVQMYEALSIHYELQKCMSLL